MKEVGTKEELIKYKMLYRLLFIVLLFFCFSCKNKKEEQKEKILKKKPISSKQIEELPENFYNNYEGVLDEEKTTLYLLKNKNKLFGGYFYDLLGTEFHYVSGSIDSLGKIKLIEKEKNIVKANWEGSIYNINELKINRILKEDGSIMKALFNKTKFCKYEFKEEIKKRKIKEEYESDSSEIEVQNLKSFGCNAEKNEYFNYILNKEFLTFIEAKSIDEKIQFFHSYDPINNNEESFVETQQYAMSKKTEVINNIVSFSFIYSYYNGGAHPGGTFRYLNIDTETNKIINLFDFIKTSKKKELSSLLEKEFINQNGKQWDFEPGNFKIPKQFLFTKKGLLFDYQQYEIGSYAMGEPKILLPYNKITSFLTDSYLSKRIYLSHLLNFK